MKFKLLLSSLLFISLIFLFGCGESRSLSNSEDTFSPEEQWKNYWYSGKAELNTYDLQQWRYDTIHEGHATMIFVTEDFHAVQQVKIDQPQADKPIEKVLKLNFVRKFNTGIYPYSTMLSAFSSLDQSAPASLVKSTFSSQEWCGQTYLQINRMSERQHRYHGFSYFESEGDQSGRMGKTYFEDAIWNQIRKNPDQLPTGTAQWFPSSLSIRLNHLEISPMQATATLENRSDTLIYTLDYDDMPRTVSIAFGKDFPFRVYHWKEDGGDGKITTARLRATKNLKYWNLNGGDDRHFRDSLGLKKHSQ